MPPRPSSFLLTVVTPFFNEGENVDRFFEVLLPLVRKMAPAVEVVAVDDGSHDDTWERVDRAAAAHPEVRGVRLSRNFGHQMAITAGLEHARGDAVVIIDGDLQDPPEVIAEMIARWQAGAEIVHARRTRRHGETVFKRATAALFYRLLNLLSERRMPLDSGDFRLMDRKVVTAFLQYGERSRFVRGLVASMGFAQDEVTFERQERRAGETKYGLLKMVRLAGDAIFSFSTRPLRLATWLGVGVSSASFLYLLWVLASAVWRREDLQLGWSSLMITILLLGGIQLVSLGILGEYVGRIYEEVKQRPLYFVRERAGYPEETASVGGSRVDSIRS